MRMVPSTEYGLECDSACRGILLIFPRLNNVYIRCKENTE
jgi:hypothetical protein